MSLFNPEVQSQVRVLTNRQLECVLLVGRGRTSIEIARLLGISEETVIAHLNEARRRYGVARRSELPVHALYRGDLDFSDLLDLPVKVRAAALSIRKAADTVAVRGNPLGEAGCEIGAP